MRKIKTDNANIKIILSNSGNKQKFVVLDFNQTSNDFVAYNQKTKTMRLFDASTPMPSQFKYLGKSKANIKQLFEVSNDK